MNRALWVGLSLLSFPLFAGDVRVTGAGATFPAPLYAKWFSEHHRLHPDEKFNYQAIGSGGGIQQVINGTLDFGATDAPMTDGQLARAPGTVHVPMVMGAVVITFNVPHVPELKLTSETLAGIFLGKLTRWNDPALAKDNPGVALPDLNITVIHRSDGSGTTAIFTDYLAKVSPEWKTRVSTGTSVRWPVGLGGKGNDGVTGQVKQTPGAVGYVELAYARNNELPVAALKNQDGEFVKPTIQATRAAASEASLPEDFRVSITNPKGKAAYPMAAFTYLLIQKDQKDAVKGEALIRFLDWAIHDGQKLAPALDYTPLPPSVVSSVEAKLKTLTVAGKPVNLASSN